MWHAKNQRSLASRRAPGAARATGCGWSGRSAKAILRVGGYELLARPDIPVATVIGEYVDVAKAFYDKRESGFVNGLLDALAKAVRPRS